MEAHRDHVPGGAVPSAKISAQLDATDGHHTAAGITHLVLSRDVGDEHGRRLVVGVPRLATRDPQAHHGEQGREPAERTRQREVHIRRVHWCQRCTKSPSCVSVFRIEMAGCDLGSNAGASCGHGDPRGAPLVPKEWIRDKHTRVVQEGARVEEPGEGLARLGIPFAEPHCLTAGGAGGWMGWRCNAKSKNTRVHRMCVRAMQCTVEESQRPRVSEEQSRGPGQQRPFPWLFQAWRSARHGRTTSRLEYGPMDDVTGGPDPPIEVGHDRGRGLAGLAGLGARFWSGPRRPRRRPRRVSVPVLQFCARRVPLPQLLFFSAWQLGHRPIFQTFVGNKQSTQVQAQPTTHADLSRLIETLN